MRLVLRILMACAAVLLLLAAALVFRLRRSVPPLAGTERLPALAASVDVAFDSLGIPHIDAASDHDAFMALGYLHARDRLWQMESLRRSAEGRLAQILGPEALSADSFLRTLDIPRAAEASLALLPAPTRALLDAYVAGVNRWIAHPARPLPPEFLVLRFRPEPWTPRQTVEVARIMSWDLANATFELSLARAAAELGPERVRELMSWYPDTGATIIRRGTGRWNRRGPGSGVRGSGRATGPRPPPPDPGLPSAMLAAHEVPTIPALAQEVLEAASMRRASNSWVIGPARSASGAPLLANDPHLLLRAPSIWYMAAIESPGFQVAGVTIAGLPAVVIGRNRRIAWGLTNMEADDADWVIERLSADSARVLTPGGWAPLEIQRDSIRLKGRRAVPFTLRRTPNGPVTHTIPPGGASDSGGAFRVLVLRWNAHDASDELSAMLAVNRATDWGSFRAGVRGFKSPEQNWVFADVDGNIGYTASGNLPVRRSGRGMLPTPGWTGEGAWLRYLDFDELPWVLNPAEGFIVTANNRIIGGEYPHHLAGNPALPYRAARIRELILARERHDARSVRAMQLDTVDVFARWARTLAADAAEAEGRRETAAALRAWDGAQGSDRTEPVVFWLWYRALQRLTFDDESTYRPGGPLHAWMVRGASRWFDDRRTAEVEDLAVLSRRAMREALERAGTLTWGAVHQTVGAHALGGVAPLERVLGLNIGPRPRAGSLYTVNVADFGSRPPFRNTHAASWRQVVDLGDMERGAMIIASGQSGNPLSRHYRDQAELWWNGELAEVPLSRSRVAAVGMLRLVPQ